MKFWAKEKLQKKEKSKKKKNYCFFFFKKKYGNFFKIWFKKLKKK